MKKYILTALAALIAILMLVSCTKTQSSSMQSSSSLTSQNDDSDIINIFNTQASDEMKGRLAGTSENEQAGQIIESYFKKIGLLAYQDNKFYHEYKTSYIKPYTSKDMTLELTIDNKTTSLTFAKDYLPYNLINKTSFNLKVTNNKDVKNPKEYIYITNDNNEKAELSDTFGAFMFPHNLQTHPLNISEISNSIRVSNEVYDKILNNIEKASVNFFSEPNIKSGSLKNIIGKIAGQNSDKALVISAHYDGAGYLQDNVVNSSIDNASGILAMLKTAKNLSQKYSNSMKPIYDIYFVGFNSEEIGMSGSKSFAQELAKTYQNNIININYDCFSNDHVLFLGYENESDALFYEDIKQEFSNNNIKYTDDVYSASDHISFSQQGNLALTLGEYKTTLDGFVHTIQDTPDKVDTAYCIKIADIMSNYIHRKGGKLFDFVTSSSGLVAPDVEDSFDDQAKIDAEIEKTEKSLNLKFNEYYTFAFSENKNTIIQLQGHRSFDKLSEFNKIFKDINVSDIPIILNQAKFTSIIPYTDTIKNKSLTASLDVITDNSGMNIPVSIKDFNKVMVADIKNIEKIEVNYTWDDKKTKAVTHITVEVIDSTAEYYNRYINRPKESLTIGNRKYDIYNYEEAIIDPVTGVATFKYIDDTFSSYGIEMNGKKIYIDTRKWVNDTSVGYTKEEIYQLINSIPMSDLEAIAKLVE